MNSTRIISVIDSHTAGEPTRIVAGGLPYLPGASVAQKRDFFKSKYDNIRKAILWEPRGHRDMFGAILTEPCHPRAQVGVFFVESDGYLDMCGHGSIGVATVCLQLGIISKKRPRFGWFLDTPAGLVSFKPHFDGDNIKAISVRNVPSFLYQSGIALTLPDKRELKAEIAFGGNFFLLVDAAELGVRIDIKNLKALVDIGMKLRDIANAKYEVHDALSAEKKSIQLTQIYQPLVNREAHSRNVVVFGKGQVDRSPCGTGTSARMASLYAKGLLGLGESYVQESIMGTLFSGKLVSRTKVGTFPAVVPEITGTAWITGLNQLVFDPNDPLSSGFFLD
jgi:proline racemase